MSGNDWTLEDIDWNAFDPSKVEPAFVQVVKAAALVEHNGGDYTAYLANVFPDDPVFMESVTLWGQEEVRHGKALARWAALADPTFDFDAAFARFTSGYRLPLEVTESVRGSRCGELVARCIVETGTSSFYSALADAADEPLLQQICRKIAADEFRHYKLFYTYLNDYVAREELSWFRRLRVALGRIGEAEDDELAYAFYAANLPLDAVYDRDSCARRYLAPVYGVYRRPHTDRAVAMISKAVGIRLWPSARRILASGLLNLFQWRAARA